MPASPSRSATRPAAARIPTWRIPPPRSLRARVLEYDEAGDRVVDVGRVAEGVADLLQIEGSVGLLVDRTHRCADHDRVARRLVQHDVAVRSGDDLLASLDVGHLRHEVAH